MAHGMKVSIIAATRSGDDAAVAGVGCSATPIARIPRTIAGAARRARRAWAIPDHK